jgi:hypothetical protein
MVGGNDSGNCVACLETGFRFTARSMAAEIAVCFGPQLEIRAFDFQNVNKRPCLENA